MVIGMLYQCNNQICKFAFIKDPKKAEAIINLITDHLKDAVQHASPSIEPDSHLLSSSGWRPWSPVPSWSLHPWAIRPVDWAESPGSLCSRCHHGCSLTFFLLDPSFSPSPYVRKEASFRWCWGRSAVARKQTLWPVFLLCLREWIRIMQPYNSYSLHFLCGICCALCFCLMQLMRAVRSWKQVTNQICLQDFHTHLEDQIYRLNIQRQNLEWGMTLTKPPLQRFPQEVKWWCLDGNKWGILLNLHTLYYNRRKSSPFRNIKINFKAFFVFSNPESDNCAELGETKHKTTPADLILHNLINLIHLRQTLACWSISKASKKCTYCMFLRIFQVFHWLLIISCVKLLHCCKFECSI